MTHFRATIISGLVTLFCATVVLTQQYNTTLNPGCICPAIFAPVCGTDGVTYPNACTADCQGVPIASNGSCPTTSTRPPPTTTGAGCLCTLEFAPVCGSDGKTYSNACMARCAGVYVARNGAC